MKTFALINAQIVTPKEIFDGSVLVSNGKIKEVKRGKSAKFQSVLENQKIETIDLDGKFLLPGLIDVHVHFRTPGNPEKEDWITGSKAALAGGVTTVLDMPNTNPPTVDEKTLAEKRKLVAKQALVNYGFYVGATRSKDGKTNLEEIKKLKNIAGVKIFMGSSTGNLLLDQKADLEKFMEENSGTHGSAGESENSHLLAIHAELQSCIQEHTQKYLVEHGGVGAGVLAHADAAVHSKIRAAECAHDAVKEVLHLAKKYDTRVHICHVSSALELDSIRKFKDGGARALAQNVSVEVTPHHLFLSDQDYEKYGNLVKVNPPLRGVQDQVALWEAVKDGTVDMIATDHAPHTLDEKKLPYEQAPSGIPGVQTMLPLLLNAVNEGVLSLEKVVELCSANPARLFGIKGKGAIEAGYDADFAVVDMALKERICHNYLWTKVDWSPFHGWVLQGFPVMTFVGGELMYEWRDKFGKWPGKEVEFVG
ncbi:MAG: dihydroorotase [Candidatus Gracilibacteria bacterium]|jgi:dihydroorotase